MIGYIAALSVVVVIVAFIVNIRAGVIATLLLHPVAACGWHVNYFLFGIKLNPLVLLGVLVPMFVFLRAFTRGPSFSEMPLFVMWTVYLCYNIFAGTLHAIDEGPARRCSESVAWMKSTMNEARLAANPSARAIR